jgi:hydroxymethylbilane synthase
MQAPIRIASRGSALALAQANSVLAQCRAACPDQAFELQIIRTTGDRLQTASLASTELPKGLFTKEIEEALLRNEADLAVHSLKDLPTELPAGLKLGAVTRRADARDVLVYRDLEYFISHVDTSSPVQQRMRGFRASLTLAALPYGATVATSSTRRTAQLQERRPDLKVVPIRGNVGTRLQKVAQLAQLDATLLAAAGLERLGFQVLPNGQLAGQQVPPGLAATPLAVTEMLPCVGQGAIGIEMRENDTHLNALCAAVNHAETLACVAVERAFLQAMGGGCNLAVAAFAEVVSEELRLRAVSYLGGQAVRGEKRCALSAGPSLGKELALEFGSARR